ncbi:MAG TPA: preprotein translocase subunit YajC [Mycobacteriales bacterium]|nr:preprotein translocase subunit YajC [Mycobacteriales bacterium]
MLLAQESGGSPVSSLLFFAFLLVVMYLLLIRPQRARAKALSQVRASLEPGARVMTTAGLHATVTAVDDDGTVLLEIAPGVQARFAAQAVVQVLEPAASSERGPDEAV